jgi:hypothetical protein
MTPAALGQVLQFLTEVPAAGDDKVSVLIGWAKAVGVTVNASQRARVRNSGNDR